MATWHEVMFRQEWVPLGTFWSGDWRVPEDGIYAQTIGRDRLELLRKSTYSTSQVQMNKTLYDLAQNILQDAGLTEEEYYIDTELQQLPVPYAYFEPQSHREALRKVAEACLGQVYCDREGIIRIEGPSFLQSQTEPVMTITQDDYFRKDNPVKWSEIANYIEVETQPLRPDVAQEVYRSNEPISITAGQTKTITVYYNHTPCIEATATLENAVSGAEITKATYYAWGADITVTSTNTSTFTKLADPSTLPTGAGYGCAFDPTGTYLAVAHFTSPLITIYKRDGNTFTKLANPATRPTGVGRGCAFDPTGTYLAVAHTASPYITIYKRDGDTFAKFDDPSTLPTGSGYGCTFDPTGTYLAVAHSGSPYITIYKRGGDTFTKLANPSTLPTGTGNGCTFDPTGTYLAVAHGSSPYITIYKRDGDTFAKLDDPSILPNGYGNGCAFDPTGTYLAVALSTSPYITIYKRDGDTFAKLDGPSTLPTGYGYGCAFDPTGTYLVVAHWDSPYITIYKRDGDTFAKLDDPSILPTGNGYGCTFDPTGTYLAVAHGSSRYITIYKRSGDTFELVINAKPLKVLNKEKAIAKDNASITDNGMLKYTFPANSLVQTREVAQKIADTLLAYYKDPRRDVEVEWRGNPALLLGDRIAVIDKNETNEYYVTRQELEFDGALRARLSGRRA